MARSRHRLCVHSPHSASISRGDFLAYTRRPVSGGLACTRCIDAKAQEAYEVPEFVKTFLVTCVAQRISADFGTARLACVRPSPVP